MNQTNSNARALGRCFTALAAACALSFAANVSFASECSTLSIDPANFSAAGNIDKPENANPPGNVADGKKSTRFSARWSREGSGVQLNIDLEKAKTLCNMNVSWFKGGVNGRQYEFNIATSNDNQSFKNVYQGKSALNDNFQQYNFAKTNARYVRVTVKGNSVNAWTSMNEVKLAGHDIQQQAACELIGPKGFYASKEQDTHPHPLAIDGNPDTYWAAKGFPSSLTLDYGKSFEHCHAIVKWQFGGLYNRTHDFEVRGSDDGENFNKVLYSGTSQPDSNYQRYDFKPQTARYVRLVIKSNNATQRNGWGSVSEFAMSARPANSTNPTPNPGTGFRHPGILLNWDQLGKTRAEIAQNGWKKNELNYVLGRRYGDGNRTKAQILSYRASPLVQEIACHSSENNGSAGCKEGREDGLVAYTAALAWVYTGDQRYANKAIEIMNAYANKNVTIRQHYYSKSENKHYWANEYLQKAWMGEMFPRAAEIIRHTNAGWPEHEAQNFGRWLKSSILPRIDNGWSDPGNWSSSMAAAVMNIGVYTDDRALFDKGVNIWRNTIKSAVYLNKDGTKPRPFAKYGSNATPKLHHWWGTSEFNHDGLIIETCRDTPHAQNSLNSLTNAAETAWIQGINLYQEEEQRLIAANEFMAYIHMKYSQNVAGGQRSFKLTGSEERMCNNSKQPGYILAAFHPSWEVAYNHYIGRDKTRRSMEKSKRAMKHVRSKAGAPWRFNHMHAAWPIITHGVDRLD